METYILTLFLSRVLDVAHQLSQYEFTTLKMTLEIKAITPATTYQSTSHIGACFIN